MRFIEEVLSLSTQMLKQYSCLYTSKPASFSFEWISIAYEPFHSGSYVMLHEEVVDDGLVTRDHIEAFRVDSVSVTVFA